MDYSFNAPSSEKEVTLEELYPGDLFIFKEDYVDECYVVNLACDNDLGVYLPDDIACNCLIVDLEDGLARFERGDRPVVRVEQREPITFIKKR